MVRGVIANAGRNTEQHLYTLVSAHLRAHPTTPESPLRLRIQGMPPPTLPITAPAVPRGWKINSILPLHSQALSGGGVSDNILKDVMQEMQGVAGAAQGQGQGNVEVGAVGQRRKREREGGKKR